MDLYSLLNLLGIGYIMAGAMSIVYTKGFEFKNMTSEKKVNNAYASFITMYLVFSIISILKEVINNIMQ
ncbi:MAG: hypothetical protein Q4P31_00720 [Andreesenia angusta]|nr:hypothetical protein [Andreesenia angusta]